MNILVTGSNGQLGKSLRRLVRSEIPDDRYFFSSRDGKENTLILDITDYDNVKQFIINNKIDIVVNCAAYTNVEGAELDIRDAIDVNEFAVRNLANICKLTNATLIHISTDYVFDGLLTRPYLEFDSCNPKTKYGLTKFMGEAAILQSNCNYIILRTSWLYSEYGKNFYKSIRQLALDKQVISVVDDQVGSPTYAFNLAEIIFYLIDNRKYTNYGIYHFANKGQCSWYEFATKIIELESDLVTTVVPCRSKDYLSKVNRPAYSVLDSSKLITTFPFLRIPHWTDSLKLCIKNYHRLND